MTHARLALPMGLAMGAMIPAMVHGSGGAAGLVFVLSHVAVLLGLALSVLVFPAVRAWAGRHRPSRAMLTRMALGAGLGFAAICAHCLLTWHGSVPWT